MSDGTVEVDRYLAGLEHPFKPEIASLRAAIVGSDASITERVKWNAPSFGHGGQDRVTFRLAPRDRCQLIFHRGAKVRADADAFAFEDASGLLEWVAGDRAVVTFTDVEDVRAKQAAVVALVGRRIAAA